MRILHTVEFYDPSIGGMQSAVKEISQRLSARGHHVTVATSIDPHRTKTQKTGVEIVEFDVSGNTVRGLGGTGVDTYRQFLRESRFDVVTNFGAQQWATDSMLPMLGEVSGKKVFVPTGFSALYRGTYKTYFEQMVTWMNQYDMNVFLSHNYRDINFARTQGVPENKIMVIPNGASKEEFLKPVQKDIRKKLGITNRFVILSVGTHTGLKGHVEAIRIFLKAAIKNTTLLIVGNHTSIIKGCYLFCSGAEKSYNLFSPMSSSGKEIKVVNLTRAETVDAFKTADLFLFPSNIECSPITLFESVASKTPFLSTDVGNAKEIVAWTKGGKILPTTTDFMGYAHAKIGPSARMLEHFIADEKGRKKMAECGYNAWLNEFSWDTIATQYETLYKQ